MPRYLWVFLRPDGRGKVGDALKGRVHESRQDIGEVIVYRDVETATAFDHRDDGGYSHCCATDGTPYNTNDDALCASGSGTQSGSGRKAGIAVTRGGD